MSLCAKLLGVGTYIATSPAPENIKVPLATVAYIAGMLGFAIKEALGGQTAKTWFRFYQGFLHVDVGLGGASVGSGLGWAGLSIGWGSGLIGIRGSTIRCCLSFCTIFIWMFIVNEIVSFSNSFAAHWFCRAWSVNISLQISSQLLFHRSDSGETFSTFNFKTSYARSLKDT